MAKKNIRSIRFSDELAELIDRQMGNSFTEKFENLVTRCVWELPQKEKQIKELDEQIAELRERLFKQQKRYHLMLTQIQKLNTRIEMLDDEISKALEEWKALLIADARKELALGDMDEALVDDFIGKVEKNSKDSL